MGQNTAYTNRPQDGRRQYEPSDDGANRNEPQDNRDLRSNEVYTNRLQDERGEYELSDNTNQDDRQLSALSDNEAYEHMDPPGQSDEPYYSSIRDNGN